MFRISGAMVEVGHIVGDVLSQLIRQAPRAGLEVSYHGGEFRGLSLKSNTRLKLYMWCVVLGGHISPTLSSG